MEYRLEWEENAEATTKNTKFTQIGRKLLILNKHYSRSSVLSKNLKKPINFFPHFKSNPTQITKEDGTKDEVQIQNYLIDGTNLFKNDEVSDWNIFIPTFDKSDYQFDGELCSSGYKKYYDAPVQG